MAPVVGTVTYRGQPVAGAKISFMTVGAPRSATGTSDATGRFALSTFSEGDGALVGSHIVTVFKPKVDVAIAGPDPNLDREAYLAAMDAAAQKAMQSQAIESALPAKYSDSTKSGLRVVVVGAGAGANDVPILLTD